MDFLFSIAKATCNKQIKLIHHDFSPHTAKRDSRHHSTTSFSENVVVAERGYQM